MHRGQERYGWDVDRRNVNGVWREYGIEKKDDVEKMVRNVLALVAIVFPPLFPSLPLALSQSMDRVAKTKDGERTHSVVMTTLQSQSLTLSLNDSALNPAKTAE